MKKIILIIAVLCAGKAVRSQIIIRVLSRDAVGIRDTIPLKNQIHARQDAPATGAVSVSNAFALQDAAVSLVGAADSMVVVSGRTDSTGALSFHPLRGNYFLRASYIGHTEWQSVVFSYEPTATALRFDSIILHKLATELSTYTVTARKKPIVQDIYGTTINVEGSIMSKGSSVLEILERSPGVNIDPHNGGIMLNGKTGVLVMINGRTLRIPVSQLVSMLANMSSNDIEKIELLSTPPSSYDADGSGGIIRIVTRKKSNRGINGSVSVTAGQAWGPKANAGFNLAGSGRRFDWQGSYTYALDRAKTNLYVESSQNMPVFGGKMTALVKDTTRVTAQNHSFSLGGLYRYDSFTSYGLTISGNFSDRRQHGVDWSTYTLLPDSLLFFNAGIEGQQHWRDWSASAFFERITKRKNKYSVNADQMLVASSNPSSISSLLSDSDGKPAGEGNPLFAPTQRGFAGTTINVSVIRLDAEIRLSDAIRFETGLKGTLTNSKSNSGIESYINMQWRNREETINKVAMNEYIGAAHFSARIRLGKKTELSAGVRYEAAGNQLSDQLTDSVMVNRKLNRFFPSLFLVHRNNSKEWQLSYTERVTRPGYADLASYIRYSDATAVNTGNPLLRPTISRNIRLGLIYKSIVFSLHLSRDENPIAYYQLTKTALANLLYISPQNMRYQNYYSLQINAPVRIASWWNINLGYTGGWRQFAIDYTELPVKKIYFPQSINMTQGFNLPKKYSAEISGWYSSKYFNGTTAIKKMWAVNAGIKKDLNKERGRLQLTVSDIFRSIHFVSRYGTLTEEAFSIRNYVDYNTETRYLPTFRFSYTRSFGTASRTAKQRETDNDARGRIRKD